MEQFDSFEVHQEDVFQDLSDKLGQISSLLSSHR